MKLVARDIDFGLFFFDFFFVCFRDALSHSHSKLSEARRLVLLQNVTDLISRTFSSQFVFPVVGHDDPATVSQLADLWRRWLPPEAMQTFEKGLYIFFFFIYVISK